MHAAKGRFPLHQNAFAAHLTAAGEAETVLAVLMRDLAVERMSAAQLRRGADCAVYRPRPHRRPQWRVRSDRATAPLRDRHER